MTSMEAREHLHGGYCRAGTPHCAPEKAAGGDHFVVEDLLDFSNEKEGGGDDWGFDATAGNSTEDSSTVTAVECCSNSLSGGCRPHFAGDLAFRSFADAGLSGDLCGPHEELAELEWLSNFVEESFSSEDLHKPQLIPGRNPTTSSSSAAATTEPSAPVAPAGPAQHPLFRQEATVPAKARSRRSRAAPCSWSSRLLAFSPDSELISPPSSSVTGKKATKLAKKTDLAAAAPAAGAASSEGRKCLHCQAEKTPQWRAGPMGPKTLCNACGVRYKSGRLVPEYRPAASPTFVPSKHSNSHRKVLELRRQEFQRQQLLRAGNGGAGGGGFLPRHMGIRQPM